MKVDLTTEEIEWIMHLADQSIWKYQEDFRDKDKNSDIAIYNIKESLNIYNKLKEYGFN